MNITVRRAVETDIPRISLLLGQILTLHNAGRPDLFKNSSQKYSAAEIAAMLCDSESPVFAAADENDRLVGYAFCRMRTLSDHPVRHDRRFLYLDDLCVDSELRGKGIGKLLFDAVSNYAVSVGADGIELNVWECNTTAIEFYKSLGFFTQRRIMELPLSADCDNVENEIAEFLSLPFVFDGFADPPVYTDGEIEVVCIGKNPAEPEKNFVPSYSFDIRRNDIHIGSLNFRVGYSEQLFYSGNIGYVIEPDARGHSYAEKACRLIRPLIRMHGMTSVGITNNINNAASRRTCEKLGARHLCLARVPKWHDTYPLEGIRFMNIFLWDI